jgi:hypothetical protein
MTVVNRRLSKLTRWVPAILMMVAIYIFSSVPSQEMPDFGAFDFTIKKIGHMFGYALLGYTLLYGFGREKPYAPWMALLLAVIYAITDEIHQSYVPGRFASPMDVLIDTSGALIGLGPWLWRSLRSRKLTRSKAQDGFTPQTPIRNPGFRPKNRRP